MHELYRRGLASGLVRIPSSVRIHVERPSLLRIRVRLRPPLLSKAGLHLHTLVTGLRWLSVGILRHEGKLGDLGELGDLGDVGDLGNVGDVADLRDVGDLGDLGHNGDLGHLGLLMLLLVVLLQV